MKYRVDDVLMRRQCAEYEERNIRELFAGRESLSLDEIIALDIPDADKFWALGSLFGSFVLQQVSMKRNKTLEV